MSSFIPTSYEEREPDLVRYEEKSWLKWILDQYFENELLEKLEDFVGR